MKTTEQFLEEFSRVYDGSPWYGKSICEVLKNVQSASAFARPPGKAHSIAELLAHMIGWREFLINKLEKNGKPKLRQQETFRPARFGNNEETRWQNMKTKLDDQQRQITGLLKEIGGKPGGRKLPLTVMNGIIQHDIYHLGQIALLKKQLI